ncbi:MAG: hypothetical protein LBN05_08845 [Oscillospiraceae bacterium]|jgi:hypothetical protein|nr:hypothetical protein [Oscillospiraceae bacterium]
MKPCEVLLRIANGEDVYGLHSTPPSGELSDRERLETLEDAVAELGTLVSEVMSA